MRYSLYLGKILGVKIYVHWTFIFLIGLIAWQSLYNKLDIKTFLWMLTLTIAVFACIVLHELGHAVVARRFNVLTRHITLLPIGGIAQMESIPQKPRQELLIALAGPVINLVIAGLLFLIVNNLMPTQVQSMISITPTSFVISLMAINIWLAVFNLIPAFPMDGGRILRATLAFFMDYPKATKIASGIGQVFGAAFIIIGFLYNPILIFVGFLVLIGGQSEFALVDTMSLLQSFTVNDVLIREVPTMEGSITVKAAGELLLTTQNKSFAVTKNGKIIGTITSDEILQVMSRVGEDTLVERVMNNVLLYAQPSQPLDEAWKMMQQKRNSLVLVESKGKLDGMVDEANVAEFILLRSGRPIRSMTQRASA